MNDEDRALRQKMKDAIKRLRDCEDDESEVIMQRIADRLGGYTHDEVAARHPLPESR